jgi:hypothetical protein
MTAAEHHSQAHAKLLGQAAIQLNPQPLNFFQTLKKIMINAVLFHSSVTLSLGFSFSQTCSFEGACI